MIDPAQPPQRALRPWLRAAGFMVALALVVGAIAYVAMRGGDEWARASEALRDPAWHLIALFALAVLANVALTGVFFSALMSRYGRVGFLEMQALIAATSLVNYLPLRPGLLGRVAYHKAINGIAVRDSVKVVVTGIVISVIAGAISALAVVIAIAGGVDAGWTFGLLGAAAVVLTFVFSAMLSRRWPMARMIHAASIPLAIRFVDILVWSARYAIIFALVGKPISFETAVALAIISTIATMVPFISNGLGLREWAVALAAPLLEVDLVSGFALSADLVHRAGEIIIIAAAGAAGMAYLSMLRRARSRNETVRQGN